MPPSAGPEPAGHFDAVVVGSGFGGSVMAYRLAAAGRRVLLLERGKPYPPGSFARTPDQMRTNFWDPSDRLFGMFDYWSFKGIDGLVSSGLGGGSLIYANVLLRKDRDWFVEDAADGGTTPWPIDYDDLEEHYEAAEAMIGVQRYPFEATTPKSRAMHAAADTVGRGAQWQLPPLAVSFSPGAGAEPAVGAEIPEEHPNIHGAKRYTCQLVGECDVGCNWGSKNSLDYTYLSAAARAGARIETLHEVTGLVPRGDGGGYTVDFVRHHPERDVPGASVASLKVPGSVTADRVVLSAGAFGTPYLLLQERKAGRLGNLPAALGTRFSGNGDLLMFAIRCRDAEGRWRPLDPSHGPVITTAVRFPDELDGTGATGRGFYLEDAGVPLFAVWMAELADAPGTVRRAARVAWRSLLQRITGNPQSNLSAEISQIIGDASVSHASLPLLSMGRDYAGGQMSLSRGGYLELDWTTTKSSAYFNRVRSDVTAFARAMGAEDVSDNPVWYLRRVITVHPLGGCPMAANPGDGVVSAADGEVFGHPGLHVADGSVMPSAVGPNPSLTIAAVSDRFASSILAA